MDDERACAPATGRSSRRQPSARSPPPSARPSPWPAIVVLLIAVLALVTAIVVLSVSSASQVCPEQEDVPAAVVTKVPESPGNV